MTKLDDLKREIIYTDSIHYIVIKILKKYDRPMSVKELTKKILQIKNLQGKTPRNSVSSVLQRSVYIEPTKRGFYRLKNIPKDLQM